ncbi:universal stress protein [Halosegnis rubeus]|jgi:nucleotide-binding universal stress UspA family protein|uniref:Universal stress protein n=1 Tax=Halosegnis rubeus TaxID=2212850 RepID=A0A5N5UG42_9EURY|nr:universal stress protein [Halosegnis rubeus]KAB7513447.1 universal stress protein [Halosegnis rubeus]KAB7517430.1 universal stress protein [Halosegnis rubeus]
MTRVVVPVRYPLSDHSRQTLETAIDLAGEHDAELTVLHVNLYQNDGRVTRRELRRAVGRAFGQLENVRYVVRSGFLVEETILDEVIGEDADYVVIGRKQASRWRQMVRSLVDDPDVESFLREKLDAQVVTAG